jgi:hypothetical protein
VDRCSILKINEYCDIPAYFKKKKSLDKFGYGIENYPAIQMFSHYN